MLTRPLLLHPCSLNPSAAPDVYLSIPPASSKISQRTQNTSLPSENPRNPFFICLEIQTKAAHCALPPRRPLVPLLIHTLPKSPHPQLATLSFEKDLLVLYFLFLPPPEKIVHPPPLPSTLKPANPQTRKPANPQKESHCRFCGSNTVCFGSNISRCLRFTFVVVLTYTSRYSS